MKGINAATQVRIGFVPTPNYRFAPEQQRITFDKISDYVVIRNTLDHYQCMADNNASFCLVSSSGGSLV
jgi:hypothetical protein